MFWKKRRAALDPARYDFVILDARVFPGTPGSRTRRADLRLRATVTGSGTWLRRSCSKTRTAVDASLFQIEEQELRSSGAALDRDFIGVLDRRAVARRRASRRPRRRCLRSRGSHTRVRARAGARRAGPRRACRRRRPRPRGSRSRRRAVAREEQRERVRLRVGAERAVRIARRAAARVGQDPDLQEVRAALSRDGLNSLCVDAVARALMYCRSPALDHAAVAHRVAVLERPSST